MVRKLSRMKYENKTKRELIVGCKSISGEREGIYLELLSGFSKLICNDNGRQIPNEIFNEIA